MSSLLRVDDLSAGYHGHPVVHGVDLSVEAGQIVVLVGPNGTGKTTTLQTIAGNLAPLGGEVSVLSDATTAPLHARARRGMAFVPEERSIFMRMSVMENLHVGRCDVELALRLFPELQPLVGRQGGQLSGGEQQMLALARALARRPRLLLADELSLGLAPLIVTRLLQAVRNAADSGVGVLLVEQHLGQALRIADLVHVMQRGRIVLSGDETELSGRLAEVEHLYLSGIGTHTPPVAPSE